MAENATRGDACSSPLVLAAGTLCACGLFPIPLERGGKRPALQWKGLIGKRLVDSDWGKADDYILAWWGSERPHNLGVLTGIGVYLNETQTAPLVVVDVDDEAARQLVEDTCGWPIITPTVKTSHGWHLWFTHNEPVGNRAKVKDVGLDVRGRGGYVVVPPSVHPDGTTYRWIIDLKTWPPTPMPPELAELIWPPTKREYRPVATILTTKYVSTALERELEAVRTAPEGRRNDQLNTSTFALARFVKSGQLHASEVADELLAAALAVGLAETEAKATIRSGMRSR